MGAQPCTGDGLGVRWVFGILSFSIVLSLISVFKYGLNPRSLPIIKPTYFDNKQQIGAVIFRRLFQEVRQVRGVFVRTSPNIKNGEDIWRGFFKVAFHHGKKFHLIVQHHDAEKGISGATGMMEDLPDGVSYLYMDFKSKEESERLLKEALRSGQNIFVHGSTDLSEDMNQWELDQWNGDIKNYRDIKGPGFLTITQQIFVTQPLDEKMILETCPDPRDVITYKGCQALHLSRRYYKKKLRSDRISAALERYKRDELTLFVHEPLEYKPLE